MRRVNDMKQVYPTFILNTNDNSEHPFLVCVPDMEIFTEGDTFAEAIEMARDAIGLAGISMEDNKEDLPTPSDQTAVMDWFYQSIGCIWMHQLIVLSMAEQIK